VRLRIKTIFGLLALGAMTVSGAYAATIYDAGTASACASCTFGTHLPQGPNGSLPGAGGSGINGPAGTALDGQRTYIYDQAGWVDGTVTRGDADFAMLVWDLGVGNALDTLRLYTHQDHYAGGPVSDNFVAQDLMEYSVWGSNDNLTFDLLSDVVGFDINGGGAGLPTYTFAGTAPTIVYRGGSAEYGILNAYTRDYTFGNSYRWYGIRSSSIGLDYQDGTASNPGHPNPGFIDADPELDAVAFNRGPIEPTPEPASFLMLGAGVAALALARRSRK